MGVYFVNYEIRKPNRSRGMGRKANGSRAVIGSVIGHEGLADEDSEH
jgi:hypothetical protein